MDDRTKAIDRVVRLHGGAWVAAASAYDAGVAAERARWSKLAAHVRCVEQADRVGALETRNIRMMAHELDEVLGPNGPVNLTTRAANDL